MASTARPRPPQRSPSRMSLLPALPWLLPYLSLFRLARKRPDLSDIVPAADGPLVSVIVPARNEAQAIGTVVQSVLASRYARFELLVVDDRSTDETAAIVERLAAEPAAGRLRLLRGAELPADWYGKPWACHQGAQAARGDLLLFTDADTSHGPDLLGAAVAAMEAVPADLLTVAPRQRCDSFWERLVMPQIWMLLGWRYHPDTVNHARRARDVIANGQFILVARETYRALGGHASVRAEVAEDLALAQHFWRAGKRLHFAFADRLMETRMYSSLAHIIEGWSKNIYLGGRRSYPEEPLARALVPVSLSLAMLFWLLPAVLLPLAWLGVLPPHSHAWVQLAALAAAAFWSLISIGMHIPPWYGLLYPLGAGMALYIILRSTFRGRSRVEWKGRTYGAALNRPDEGAVAR